MVGNARTSGDIDVIVAELLALTRASGVDGSFFTLLGENGVLAAGDT